MASSYLNTVLFMPLVGDALDSALQQPIGQVTPAMRELLDADFKPLRYREPTALTYYPDATWLEAHLDYIAALSGWDFLLLLDAQADEYGRTERLTETGLARSSSAIPYLAFAYGDAALAEKLAARLPPDATAFFKVVPTGDDNSRSMLLTRNSQQTMARYFGYLQHPLRLSVENLANGIGRAPLWPQFDERRAAHASAGRPLLARWQAFVQQHHAEAVRRASVAAPLDLGAHYFTDGAKVFFRAGADDEPAPLPDADPASFRVIFDNEQFGWYGADARQLWYFGRPLPCDNTATLARLPADMRFLTDGRYVYFDGEVLADVDARQVRAVPGSDWPNGFLHGDDFVVAYGSATQIPVDAASFRAVSSRYFCDKDGVYELDGTQLLIETDFESASFSVIEHYGEIYLRDRKGVAQARGSGLPCRPLKAVDAPAFRGVPGLPFLTDGKRVWQDIKVCKDLDAATLRLPPFSPLSAIDPEAQPDEQHHCRYALSGDKVFYVDGESYKALDGADAASFELLGFGVARDASAVWESGVRMAGAKPGRFAWVSALHRRWTDGANIYEFGERLTPERASATLIELPTLNSTLELNGDEYRFEGALIEGWHPATHRLAPLGCIEDQQYYYTCYSVEGGGILVWTRDYSDYPLLHYRLDREQQRWIPAGPVPAAERLNSIPSGLLMTREEFDTLFTCLPRGAEFGTIESSYENPSIVMTRWRDARSMNIRGDVEYGLHWQEEIQTEHIRPIRTPGICEAIREALDVVLNFTAPLSMATLKQMMARVTSKEGFEGFTIDAGGADGKTFLLVQSADTLLRGAWVDSMRGEQVARIGVWIDDNGFLGAEFLLGPASGWGEGSNEGFVPASSTVEWRRDYRRRIAAFLKQVADPQPAKKGKAAKKDKGGKTAESGSADAAASLASAQSETLAWCADTLPGLLSLLAPRLKKADVKTFIGSVRTAVETSAQDEKTAETVELADLAEAAAWEAVLDELEKRELLITFDKQELVQAVSLCNVLATAVGIDREFSISDKVRGDSFLEIAQDFERWLEPSGWCLIWPQGSWRSSGDDYFPAVIAPEDAVEDIVNAARALGESRYFSVTDHV